MNIKTYRLFFIVFLLSGCLYNSVMAQTSTDLSNSYYQHAVDLFEKGQYVDAESQFRKAAETAPADDNVMQSRIASYRALCAINLVQPNSESIVEDMERAYGNDPKMNEIYFAMARQFYHSEEYEKAVKWFEKVDNRELLFGDRLECMFLQGHAYFLRNNYEKAMPLFTAIINLPNNKYRIPATYYYAHIEYEWNNYASALESFQSIRNDDRLATPAVYYIVQIHARQGRYKEVISEGSELLKTATDARYAEVAGIMAEACYRDLQYDEALKYINLYKEKVDTLSRNDQFMEASVYHHLKKYPEALSRFSTLSNAKDSIGQLALYYAGDASLKTDDKTGALKYFDAARNLNFNSDITNDAWLNYIKLSMEISNNSRPLYEYRQRYPDRNIHSLLVSAYTVDKEYDKAISEIEATLVLTDRDKTEIQRLYFAQGINRMESGQYEPALQSLDNALKYDDYDPNIKSIAHYWKAEIFYRLGKYDESQQHYTEFIRSASAFKKGKEYRLAHYNIGYCFFKLKNYNDANNWFRRYVALPDVKNDKELVGNAYNRIADCYYIEKQYAAAIENYDKALVNNAPRSDYAMFQKGMAQGLNDTRQDRKVETLAAMSNKYPKSEIAPAAIFEVGRTYLRSNNFEHAAKIFTIITEQYKNSPYNQRAFIELGLINLNLGNNKQAIECYQRAILDNPGTKEAKDALVGLKNAYLEMNDPEGYIAFIDRLPINGENDSDEEKEEVRYTVAEKHYLAGECEAAIQALTSFLQLYPQSTHTIQVNFYLGDCSYRTGNYQTAKTSFEYVVSQPKDAFTELAFLGLARSCQELTLYGEAGAAYDKLYAANQSEEYRLKTLLMNAKEKEKAGEYDEALRLFNELAKGNIKTVEGAEAAYAAIDVLHKQKKNEEAIKAVFELSEADTPQQYWVARGFIVLGDIYVEQGDLTQAKNTFNSLLEGYRLKDDGIIDTVQKRLDAIK